MCSLVLYFSARSSVKMEKYDRMLPKGTSFAKADEVWTAWYKKAKMYEGESNENLKSAIKIRNTGGLSCKLTTTILMV